MKLICWNIGHQKSAWSSLPDLGVDLSERQVATDGVEEAWKYSPDMGVDVVLLQEGYAPSDDVADRIEVDPAPYHKKDPLKPDSRGKALSRCAIVKVSDSVKVEEYLNDIKSSHPGCLSAAVVTPLEGKYRNRPIHVVSFCSDYEAPDPSSGIKTELEDTSIHRLISDISLLIGRKDSFRMIAAGDINIMYGDGSSDYWRARNKAVFDRMSSIGLSLIGPHGSTQCHSKRLRATATRQLDYVFASRSMKDSIRTRALNKPEEWGPSDHCRILIEVS